jgi:hypothetical protein
MRLSTVAISERLDVMAPFEETPKRGKLVRRYRVCRLCHTLVQIRSLNPNCRNCREIAKLKGLTKIGNYKI